MNQKKNAVWVTCLLLLLLVILVGSWSRPQASTARVELPAGTVIERDDWGVPTIQGKTDADVAHGLAYAHAQDDFETLQLQFLAARGQAGLVQGFKGVKQDFLVHWMDVPAKARQGIEALAPQTQALIRGYVNGLNHYAAEHPQEVLRDALFPLTPVDVVAGFAMTSPLFFGLDKVVGALYEGEPLPRDFPVEERGSNAFVFGPSRMADGSTLLVANSHQPWKGPVAWYEVRVQSEQGWKYSGALFPGSPTPLHGHNDQLGWANTINRPDLVDVYQLKMSEDGKRYQLDGRWQELQSRWVWLKTQWGPLTLPIPQRMHRSVHGPVLKNKHGYFAVRYAGMEETRQVEQYYKLTKAANLQQWLGAMRMRAVPATNFIYGDRQGNIAMLYNASFPKRDPALNWSDVMPGDRSDLIWQELLPFEAQPWLLNPASGYIVNANNTPFKATSPQDNLLRKDFGQTVGIETDLNNRIDRAIALIEPKPKLDRADVQAIKYDKGYEKDSVIGKQMQSVLRLNPSEPLLQQALALLRQWDWNLDGQGSADGLAALVLRPLNRANFRRLAPAQPEKALADAAAFLMKHHQRLDVPLGQLLRLRRGHVDLPLTGGPDVLRAIGWEPSPDGSLVADFGDSFLMFVIWPSNGEVSSQTISPYGAAVSRPQSPHFNDQALLFTQEKLKPNKP